MTCSARYLSYPVAGFKEGDKLVYKDVALRGSLQGEINLQSKQHSKVPETSKSDSSYEYINML